MAKNCPWCFIKCSHINSSHRSIEIVLKCNFPYTRSHQIYPTAFHIVNGDVSKFHKAVLFSRDFWLFDLSSLLTFAVDSHEEGKFDCSIQYHAPFEWCNMIMSHTTQGITIYNYFHLPVTLYFTYFTIA